LGLKLINLPRVATKKWVKQRRKTAMRTEPLGKREKIQWEMKKRSRELRPRVRVGGVLQTDTLKEVGRGRRESGRVRIGHI